jgi:hypothetical protein
MHTTLLLATALGADAFAVGGNASKITCPSKYTAGMHSIDMEIGGYSRNFEARAPSLRTGVSRARSSRVLP